MRAIVSLAIITTIAVFIGLQIGQAYTNEVTAIFHNVTSAIERATK